MEARRLRQGRPFGRLDHLADVVKSLSALCQPVGVDAGTVQRLDQLILRAAAVQHDAKRPFGGETPIFAPLPLRAKDPAAPRSRCKARVE
jgi:hypothetical protein